MKATPHLPVLQWTVPNTYNWNTRKSEVRECPCVGWLTLPANPKLHRSFEYAAAGELWDRPEQSVPVFYREPRCSSFPYSFEWHGVRMSRWFGAKDRDSTPTPGSQFESLDAWYFGSAYLAGRFRPAPGWRIEVLGETYDSGEPMARLAQDK